MNGSDVVDHVEKCEACQAVEVDPLLTDEEKMERQSTHLAEMWGTGEASAMPEWIIETAGQKWQEGGDTYEEALRTAWKRRPPDDIGMLVSLQPADNADDDATFYIKGERAAELCGLEVETSDGR